MLILSNALTDTPDEGSLKVASCLAARLKAAGETVVTYERESTLTDIHLNLNKLLLNPALIRLLWQRREPVLYLPFPTRALPMAVRLFLLSLFSPGKVIAVLPLTREHGLFSRWLLKRSRVSIAALSRNARDFYAEIVGENRATYLKTGVDTRRFRPVPRERAAELKEKYGLAPDKKVLLHVGHLKQGRNIGILPAAGEDWQILLVVSTFTEQDPMLRQTLDQHRNITIIDEFIPSMEEIYQLSDAYFFPVREKDNCIDVPLSCLEAAACGIPVITTAYGEMAAFRGKPGFFLLNETGDDFRELLALAETCTGKDIPASVAEYDWGLGAAQLRGMLE